MKLNWFLAGLSVIALLLGAVLFWLSKKPAYVSVDNFKEELSKFEEGEEKEKLSYRFWQYDGDDVEGFLWGINSRQMYLINLSGVKGFKFSNKSAMYYHDICGNGVNDGFGKIVEEELFFSQKRFAKRVKTGDYVNLTTYQEENGYSYIDKVWGYSGKFYLNGLVLAKDLCKN